MLFALAGTATGNTFMPGFSGHVPASTCARGQKTHSCTKPQAGPEVRSRFLRRGCFFCRRDRPNLLRLSIFLNQGIIPLSFQAQNSSLIVKKRKKTMGCCSDTSGEGCSDQGCCSGQGCSSQVTPGEIDVPAGEAARRLARLVESRPELQAFFKASEAVSRDPQASLLLRQIRFSQSAYDPSEGESPAEKLIAKLEALPVFCEYRVAERQVKELFENIDRTISAAAGMPFAANAKASACG
jgi:cell fate (sporulation/competence/biofilm development) regulator YlbF (YheA/YmcA/DUF963 family)